MKEEYNIIPEEIASDLLDSVTERAGSEYLDEFITTKSIEIENHIREQMKKRFEDANNIIFRGMSEESERYIVGHCSTVGGCPRINGERIRPETLAVSLPGMIDREYNRLYASLDKKKGVGGSIVKLYYPESTKTITKESFWDPEFVLIMDGYKISYLKYSISDFSDNIIFDLTYNRSKAKEIGIL